MDGGFQGGGKNWRYFLGLLDGEVFIKSTYQERKKEKSRLKYGRII